MAKFTIRETIAVIWIRNAELVECSFSNFTHSASRLPNFEALHS